MLDVNQCQYLNTFAAFVSLVEGECLHWKRIFSFFSDCAHLSQQIRKWRAEYLGGWLLCGNASQLFQADCSYSTLTSTVPLRADDKQEIKFEQKQLDEVTVLA